MEVCPDVTPCVGVWIETLNKIYLNNMTKVTPCVGVWIETDGDGLTLNVTGRHTLRGCVD